MSNLSLIQPQRVDFDTCQTCDWLDGLPMIGTPTIGGTMAGTANVGNAALSVASVAGRTAYGAHIATVTAIAFGLTRVSVVDPSGAPTGYGVVGLPIYAGGITFTLAQGPVPLAVGDSFALSVVRAPVDLSGLQFDLDARESAISRSYAFQASNADTPATIINGGPSGVIAMALPRAYMARRAANALGYPYAITATDPATGLKVPAFIGTIYHAAIAALIGRV